MTDWFQTSAGPMTEHEVDQLAGLLDRYGHPDDGMNLEALDGYLSALVVAPALVMPSDYMHKVWGQGPEFETEAEAKDAHALIMRLWNHIVWRVQQELSEEGSAGDPRVLPLLALPDSVDTADESDPDFGISADFPVAAVWGMGFMQAVALRADDWQSWCDRHDQIAEDFGRIFELTWVHLEQLREMGLEDAKVPDRNERLETMMELPAMLQDMYFQRLADLRPAPARRGDRPGRNDACLCGSGRKYKKCCGISGEPQ